MNCSLNQFWTYFIHMTSWESEKNATGHTAWFSRVISSTHWNPKSFLLNKGLPILTVFKSDFNHTLPSHFVFCCKQQFHPSIRSLRSVSSKHCNSSKLFLIITVSSFLKVIISKKKFNPQSFFLQVLPPHDSALL